MLALHTDDIALGLMQGWSIVRHTLSEVCTPIDATVGACTGSLQGWAEARLLMSDDLFTLQGSSIAVA